MQNEEDLVLLVNPDHLRLSILVQRGGKMKPQDQNLGIICIFNINNNLTQ